MCVCFYFLNPPRSQDRDTLVQVMRAEKDVLAVIPATSGGVSLLDRSVAQLK